MSSRTIKHTSKHPEPRRQSVFTGDISLPQEIVERCNVIFKKFDKDGSGEIDRFELTEAMTGVAL